MDFQLVACVIISKVEEKRYRLCRRKIQSPNIVSNDRFRPSDSKIWNVEKQVKPIPIFQIATWNFPFQVFVDSLVPITVLLLNRSGPMMYKRDR